MIDIKDKTLLESLVGSRVVEFQFCEENGNELLLDAVIIEKGGEQYCVFADNCDDLGIVKYA
jgi:hypothetical protein